MMPFTFKSTIKAIIIGLIIFIVAGCSAHIRPKPDFTWPEMADSKINGKIAVYISPVAAKTIAQSLPDDEFRHKDLLIGEAVAKLTHQACLAAFQEVVILKKLPETEQLKAAGFRGIFKLDSILTIVNMPTSSARDDTIAYTDMSIRLGINCSAEDFLIKQDIPPTFGPDGQYGKRMNHNDIKAIDKILRDLSERILKESGTVMAQSLVNIYGARE